LRPLDRGREIVHVNHASDADRLVLVIDDEPGIVDFIALGLRAEGYRVAAASTGRSGLEQVRQQQPDAVIVDVGLPDLDGFEVVREIRTVSHVPIIMLTARGELGDRVRGLDLGADDYVAKPFHFAELVARLRAHLRRQGGRGEPLRVGDLTLDPGSHSASRRERQLNLTPREYELLELFLRHPGEVLSKERILDRLWGYAFDDNLVEVYVGYLRRKLGEPPMIETLRGAGYVLREATG
jgi:two-component system response regulator MprA